MLFNSYIFILCFLPISVIGYYLINQSSWKKRDLYFFFRVGKKILEHLFLGGWQLSEKITEYVLDLIEIRVIMRLGLAQFLFPALASFSYYFL